MGNALRNFNYLVACPKTGDALLIDPLDASVCLHKAQELQLKITHVINTHEHWDHVAGNTEIVAATGAHILCHFNAVERIPSAQRGLHSGEVLTIGSTVSIKVLDTPGHTMTHVCLLASSLEHSQVALFSGDTLFNAGCGNCYNGGNVNSLFHTLHSKLITLDEETTLYPGHDYLQNNLRFALSREPSNKQVQILLDQKVWEKSPYVTTIKMEKEINPFFRLANPEIRQLLQYDFPDLNHSATEEEVFTCLRALRNKW